MIAAWNVTSNFGQPAQVRLTDEGTLEIKHCGAGVWRLLCMVNISIYTVKDIQERLKNTEGIAKVKRQRG